jgi:16S rRNA (uracil1498-N3)-methyltransferase
MKVHRFYTKESPGESFVIRDPELLHQLTRVLHLSPHETVVFFNGDGMEWQGKIVEIRKDMIEFKRESLLPNQRDPEKMIHLYAAVLKRENFDWIVEKATEVGARSIHPILTERTVKLKLNPERLLKIAQEAAEQSGRGIIPQIEPVISARAAFSGAPGQKFFLEPDGEVFPSETPSELSLFVGPEGGWSEAERALAREEGCVPVRLGSTILRAETAAVIAVYRALLS